MFLWRNKKNIGTFQSKKKVPYLELCCHSQTLLKYTIVHTNLRMVTNMPNGNFSRWHFEIFPTEPICIICKIRFSWENKINIFVVCRCCPESAKRSKVSGGHLFALLNCQKTCLVINLGYFFLFLHKTHMLWVYSLKAPQKCAYNEYQQHMFLYTELEKKILEIFLNIPP